MIHGWLRSLRPTDGDLREPIINIPDDVQRHNQANMDAAGRSAPRQAKRAWGDFMVRSQRRCGMYANLAKETARPMERVMQSQR